MGKIKLYNGLEISDICFGTSILFTDSFSSKDIIHKMGYCLKHFLKDTNGVKREIALKKIINICMNNDCNMFDTSRAYAGSEFLLGKYLNKFNRNDYTIITKLSNKYQFSGSVRESLLKSLKELNTDYIDLYLMHWPVTEKYIESWKEMEKLYKEGLCKAIGVCNCNIHHLEEIEQKCEIKPMVNQIECHPLFTQNEIRDYCMKKNIKIMAYTSTARMDERLRKTVLTKIAQKYNKSIATVILKWHQQIGNIPIVNSFNANHMMENLDLKNFILTNEEVEQINNININSRLRYDPDNCDFSQL